MGHACGARRGPGAGAAQADAVAQRLEARGGGALDDLERPSRRSSPATFTAAGRPGPAALPAADDGARRRRPAVSATGPPRRVLALDQGLPRARAALRREPRQFDSRPRGHGQRGHRPPLDLGSRVWHRLGQVPFALLLGCLVGLVAANLLRRQVAEPLAATRRRRPASTAPPPDAAHHSRQAPQQRADGAGHQLRRARRPAGRVRARAVHRAALLRPADHRTDARARGEAAPGRGADPLQGRVPRQHEPRDPHADERRAGHGRTARRHRARPAATPLRRLDARRRRDDDADHQRHPRRLEDRGRQDGAGARRRSTCASSPSRPASCTRARPSARSSR